MRDRQREEPPNANQQPNENETLKQKVQAQPAVARSYPGSIRNCLSHFVLHPISSRGAP
jgi:hypothetical protein